MLDSLEITSSFDENKYIFYLINKIFKSYKLKEKSYYEICEYDSNMRKYKENFALCYDLGFLEKVDDEFFQVPEKYRNLDYETLINAISKKFIETIIFYPLKLEGPSIVDINFDYDIFNERYSLDPFKLNKSNIWVLNILKTLKIVIEELDENYNPMYYLDDKWKYVLDKGSYRMSLEDLKKLQANQEKQGEAAEQFVLEYEKKRLDKSQENKIKQISKIDVSAGFDIISFSSSRSKEYDRYIEVKSYLNSDIHFYWSKVEINTAKKLSDNYYIYIVDINKMKEEGYNPRIIKNPYKVIFSNEEWNFETESILVKPSTKN